MYTITINLNSDPSKIWDFLLVYSSFVCTVGWCKYLRAAPLELQPVTRIIVSALLVRYPVVGEGEDTRLVPVSGCLAPAIHLLIRQTTRHIQGVAIPLFCALLT